MKTKIPFSLTLFFTASLCIHSQNTSNIQQPTSINTDGAAPAASAIFDVQATDKGMLVPRMTSAQRAAIASPATGLLVFDTDANSFWFYNGSAWAEIKGTYTAGAGISIAGNTISNTGDTNPADDLTTGSPAGGGLAGTYPNPTIAANAVGSAEIANGSVTVADLGFGAAATGQVLTATGASAAAWQAPAVQKVIADADNDTKIQVEESPDEDIVRFDLGGTENMVLRKNAAGAPRLELPNAEGNTFIGTNAGNANTMGNINTAFGKNALSANTIGNDNTATGHSALASNTEGDQNTAIGKETLYSNTSGNLNTAVGLKALYSSTDRSGNVAVGDFALYTNGMGAGLPDHAIKNTAVGSKALYNNTTGYKNSAFGESALFSNMTGDLNTANGWGALYSNTTGVVNTANGHHALYSNTTGIANTANGGQALYSNTVGWYNTANGNDALYSNMDGFSNTAIGNGALYSNTTGSLNSAFGVIANVGYSNLDNATALGANAMVEASNSMVLGSVAGVNGATNSVKVGIGVNAPSHYLTVKSPDTETMRLMGPTGSVGYGARLNFGDGDYVFIEEPEDDKMRIQANKVGINIDPMTNTLEVNGDASKTTAGDWLANSDARLKKNIQPLNSREMLQKVLALQGITYEWDDGKTGSQRPAGTHYGFTAQNIQQVFPTLVSKDNQGYLQTAYGTLDAMTVEALRALNEKIEMQQAEIERLKKLESQLEKLTAALQGAGIELK